jgi:hypothetical protein
MSATLAVPSKHLSPSAPAHWRPRLWGMLFFLTSPVWGVLYLNLIMWLHFKVMVPVFGWPDWFSEELRSAFWSWTLEWLLNF